VGMSSNQLGLFILMHVKSLPRSSMVARLGALYSWPSQLATWTCTQQSTSVGKSRCDTWLHRKNRLSQTGTHYLWCYSEWDQGSICPWVLCPAQAVHTAHLWTNKHRKGRIKALAPRSLPHGLLLTTMLIGQLNLIL